MSAATIAATAAIAAPARWIRQRGLTDVAIRYGLIAALIVLGAFLSLTRDTFLTSTNIWTMLLTSAVSIIIAVPLGMLLQTGGVDFSVGSALGLAVVVGGRFMADFGWHPLPACAAVLVVLGGVGAFNGALCARWNLSPVVVTIGMLFLLRGLAFVLTGSEVRRDFGRGFSYLGRSRTVLLDVPTPVLVAAVWSGVLLVLWYRTRWGRRAHACGAAEEAAVAVGIDVAKSRLSLYVLVSVGAGIVGLIQLSRLDSAPAVTGQNLELEVLTAVLLAGVAFTGGHGSAANVITGVLFLTVLGNGLIQYRVDTDWSRVVEGAVLVSSAGFQVAIVRAAGRRRFQPAEVGGGEGGESEGGGGGDGRSGGGGGGGAAPGSRSTRREPVGDPALEVRGATKRFGPVVALDDVTLAVHPGEVVALLGDNGAGKTTLVKALTGVHALDGGSVLIGGRTVQLRSPLDARTRGIEAVHQGPGVVGLFDAAENLFLGREPIVSNVAGRSIGWIDKRRMRSETAAELEKLRVRIPDLRTPVASLSGGQRQSIEVARAGRWARSIVLLDEPTAALGVEQSAQVLALIRQLSEAGTAVLLVTHDMPHVLQICDRVVVLRRGRVVAVEPVGHNTDVERLVGLITGAVSQDPSRA